MIEHGESIISSIIQRSRKEETGLTVSNLELCGVQNWTDPKDQYRYLVFAIKPTIFGNYQSSDEGQVFWMDLVDLKECSTGRRF